MPDVPEYPKGPLNPPGDDQEVALRVGITVRFSGTVDTLAWQGDIDARGGINGYIEHMKEELGVSLWQQGAMTDDDIEIDDLDQWNGETSRWDTVPE